jgi:hypothetical protein
MFLDNKREDKSSGQNGSKHYPKFSSLLIFSWIRFWFVTVVHKHLNCAMFSKDLMTIFMSWFCPAVWWRNSNIILSFLCVYF